MRHIINAHLHTKRIGRLEDSSLEAKFLGFVMLKKTSNEAGS